MTLEAALEEAQGRAINLEALEERVRKNDERRTLAERLAAGAVLLSAVLVVCLLFVSAALVARNKAVEEIGKEFARQSDLDDCQDTAFIDAVVASRAGEDDVDVALQEAYDVCDERFPPPPPE